MAAGREAAIITEWPALGLVSEMWQPKREYSRSAVGRAGGFVMPMCVLNVVREVATDATEPVQDVYWMEHAQINTGIHISGAFDRSISDAAFGGSDIFRGNGADIKSAGCQA